MEWLRVYLALLYEEGLGQRPRVKWPWAHPILHSPSPASPLLRGPWERNPCSSLAVWCSLAGPRFPHPPEIVWAFPGAVSVMEREGAEQLAPCGAVAPAKKAPPGGFTPPNVGGQGYHFPVVSTLSHCWWYSSVYWRRTGRMAWRDCILRTVSTGKS